MSRKHLLIGIGMLVWLSMALAACGGGGAVQTIIVEGTPMVVTPTTAPVSFDSADPTTFTQTTFGEPEGFDPAYEYETAINSAWFFTAARISRNNGYS